MGNSFGPNGLSIGSSLQVSSSKYPKLRLIRCAGVLRRHSFTIKNKKRVWALWETASARSSKSGGRGLRVHGTAASIPYAAAWRSNAAGLIWHNVECRRCWL